MGNAILQISIDSYEQHRLQIELFDAQKNSEAVNHGNHISVDVKGIGLNSYALADSNFFTLGYAGVLKEINEGRTFKFKLSRQVRTLHLLYDCIIVHKNEKGEKTRILLEEITPETIINVDKETRMVLMLNPNVFHVDFFFEQLP